MLKRVVGRVDRPDDLAEAAGVAFGAVVDLFQRSAGRVIGRQGFAGELADHRDLGEVGAEVVVQVAGDAGAFLGEGGAGVGGGDLPRGAALDRPAR